MRPTDCRRFKRSCGETERDAPATNDPPRSGAPWRQCGAFLLVVVRLETVRIFSDCGLMRSTTNRRGEPASWYRGREAATGSSMQSVEG